MKTRKRLILLGLVLMVLVPAVGVMAGSNILDGTSWPIQVTTNASVAKVGKITAVTLPVIEFTNGSEFRIMDDSNPILTGTYSIDAKGKISISADTDILKAFLETLIWDVVDTYIVDNVQVDFQADDIDLKTQKVTCSLKSKDTISTLTINANIKAAVTAQVTDDTGLHSVTSTITVTFAGTGYQDSAAYTATSWSMVGTEKASVKVKGRSFSMKNPILFTMPLDAKNASAEELPGFELDDNSDTTFSGTYLRNKNNLTFIFDTVAIEQLLEDAVTQTLNDMGYVNIDIWIDTTAVKSTGTIGKTGQTIKMSLQATFVCYVVANNELISFKIPYSLNASGTIQ